MPFQKERLPIQQRQSRCIGGRHRWESGACWERLPVGQKLHLWAGYMVVTFIVRIRTLYVLKKPRYRRRPNQTKRFPVPGHQFISTIQKLRMLKDSHQAWDCRRPTCRRRWTWTRSAAWWSTRWWSTGRSCRSSRTWSKSRQGPHLTSKKQVGWKTRLIRKWKVNKTKIAREGSSPQVKELKALIDGEVPAICSVQKRSWRTKYIHLCSSEFFNYFVIFHRFHAWAAVPWGEPWNKENILRIYFSDRTSGGFVVLLWSDRGSCDLPEAEEEGGDADEDDAKVEENDELVKEKKTIRWLSWDKSKLKLILRACSNCLTWE